MHNFARFRPAQSAGYPRSLVLLAFVVPCILGIASQAHSDSTSRGEYLTTILGCAGCHTEGALIGNPTGPWLAGSKIGVAYSEDERGFARAVVFPRNLTSDKETGIGNWTKPQIMQLISTGSKHTGEIANSVMPWANYGLLKKRDLADIADYLMSLPPVRYEVPQTIGPDEEINESYVRIGIYYFIPTAE